MNLNDIDFKITFPFDVFEMKKKYDLVLIDFFHPDEKTASKSQKYTSKYYIFKAYNTKDYMIEGIPKNIEYFQEFSLKVFTEAYGRYRYTDSTFFEFTNKHRNAKVNVQITFERETMKKFKIHNIILLKNDLEK